MKSLLLFFLFSASCVAQEYFPKSCFASSEGSHNFKAEWYSSQLKALKEAPLYAEKIDAKIECYRFTWLRTFHHPVVLRVDVQKEGTGKFTIKVASGAGGYEPGKLVRNETKNWDGPRVKKIRDSFAAEKFFEIQSYEEGKLGCDGAEWIIEAVRDGKYHIISRWSPTEGSAYALGMELIKSAPGGDLKPIY